MHSTTLAAAQGSHAGLTARTTAPPAKRLGKTVSSPMVHSTAPRRQHCVPHAKKMSLVHQKYVHRTREELEKMYLDEWLATTGMDGSAQRKMTLWSFIWFVPMWLRFTVIPEPIRYAVSLAWGAVKPFVTAARNKCILAGAKLDSSLNKSEGPVKFSTAEVLRRYHGKISIWRRIYYRVSLLKGRTFEELNKDVIILDPATGQTEAEILEQSMDETPRAPA